MNPVRVEGKKLLFDGVEVLLRARLSGKFMPYLHKLKLQKCEDWIAHNQELGVNALRVYGEESIPWGDKPHYSPWPIQQMLNGNRVREHQVDRDTLEGMYSLSHDTGMAFILVIDNTLKNMAGMTPGMIGHVVSRTLDVCRQVAEQYPKAKVIFDFHNGWDTALDNNIPLKQQAKRVRRWAKGEGEDKITLLSFEKPGLGFEPEQYPDAVITVSETGAKHTYPVGSGIDSYQIASVHSIGFTVPGRRPYHPLFISETGYATESNYYLYADLMEQAKRLKLHFCICDEKGARTDTTMAVTQLEEYLGAPPPPPPPPPPEEWETVWEGGEFRLQRRLH